MKFKTILNIYKIASLLIAVSLASFGFALIYVVLFGKSLVITFSLLQIFLISGIGFLYYKTTLLLEQKE